MKEEVSYLLCPVCPRLLESDHKIVVWPGLVAEGTSVEVNMVRPVKSFPVDHGIKGALGQPYAYCHLQFLLVLCSAADVGLVLVFLRVLKGKEMQGTYQEISCYSRVKH